ncbi:MAG: DAK2 domain-containing protein [Cyanobacteria bacterium]|nr:DAK2 domain-containing protein [Cyanobacteriota bacterium]
MDEKIEEKQVKDIINIIIADFKENESKINNLNVFPVPDGDTGTNMLLTLKSIQQEILNLDNYAIKNIGDRVSFGALMGARGNSGVILSQILKGFFDFIIISNKESDFHVIKNAIKAAMDLAYSSVQNPTEGTMLTTIKDIYKIVESMNDGSIPYMDFLNIIIKETEKSVQRTTFLLPVLKQAGVVDAGAQGILEILIGLKKALIYLNNGNNEKYDNSHDVITPDANGINEDENTESIQKEESKIISQFNVKSDLKYIYCTEFVIKGEKINLPRLREDIESLGDSALVVGNDELVKIHVHTNFPNKVIKRSIREGTLHEIQINNMVDQSKQAMIMENLEETKPQRKEQSIIAIANGAGFEEIFKSIGVDIVVTGGQSMNPSTYEIVKAINKVDCDKIIILPNNKNIIPTANQAKKIVKKEVFVIPTVTIPQGIAAALNFNPDSTTEDNVSNMEKSISNIKTGEITTAIRDANLYVGEIKKGAFIGLNNGNVRVITDNLIDAVTDLVRDMITGKEEVITFYFGEGTTMDDNQKIKSKINKFYQKLEIEFHKGGQPLYPYIFSIE